MADDRDSLELLTQRLSLRILDPQDAELCVRYASENRDHHAATSPRREQEYYVADYWAARLSGSRERFQQKSSVELFIFRKDQPSQIIGACVFDGFMFGVFQACYLGFNLDSKVLGRGYMTEALRAAIPFVFSEIGIHRIMANYIPTNVRSGSLLRRLGFRVEGYARDYLCLNGEWQDHILTALHSDEWNPT